MLRRSFLFIPGNNPTMLLSSNILGADCLILDLEDAVAINQKDSARILVKEALQTLDFSDTEVFVRINPVTSMFWQEDCLAIIPCKPSGIVIPKATQDAVETIENFIKDIENQEEIHCQTPFILIAESAYGVETIVEVLRSSQRIVAVLFGAEDFTADMAIARTSEGFEIQYARSKIAVACKAFSVLAIDTPYVDIENFAGFNQDILRGKALGYKGKACINPRQIEAVHQQFAPTQVEIDEAIAILEEKERAFKEGIGVFSYRGKMIDQPIITRAETVLNLARKLRLIP